MKQSISVVVASGVGGEFLFRCLDSLREQVDKEGTEMIVVDRVGGATAKRLRRDYGWVHLLPVDLGYRPSVPDLGKIGAEAAGGAIVVIPEEHCTAPPEWLAAVHASSSDDDAAIGGPILDNDFDRLRDWVVYFSEYHNYLPPWPAKERYLLNGADIAYSREKLLRHRDSLDSGCWEVVLHPRLVRDGRFRAVPGMGVHHTGPFDFGYYLGQRYLLSRVWGGTQRNQVCPTRRGLYLATAPVLPFVLLARIAARVCAGRRRIGRFLQALALPFPVSVAYVWGEWLGYLAGPGDALERVE